MWHRLRLRLSILISALKGLTSLVWTMIPGGGYYHVTDPPTTKVVRIHYLLKGSPGGKGKRKVTWFKFRVM